MNKLTHTWQLSAETDWHALESQFSWVKDMRGVPQDPIYHAEGDVAIHTEMVLKALVKTPEYQNLDVQNQHIIWAAALLHDVEKRSTTKTEAGRITSRNHAKRGEQTTRDILFAEIPTPFWIRESICALVRLHGLPLWFIEKENLNHALLQAADRVPLSLLSLLAKADILGRECEDAEEMLDRIALFEEEAKQLNCLHAPYPFVNDHARFSYFSKSNGDLNYVPFDEFSCEVILMCALPGMGKDYYIKTHYPDYPVISLDALRRERKLPENDLSVIRDAKEMAKVYLRQKQSFIWNATNLRAQIREQLIALFTAYKARVTLIYLEVPYRVWQKQNKEREHAVPSKILNKMVQGFEFPQKHEAHSVRYITANESFK